MPLSSVFSDNQLNWKKDLNELTIRHKTYENHINYIDNFRLTFSYLLYAKCIKMHLNKCIKMQMKKLVCIISILLDPHTNLGSAFLQQFRGSWFLGKRLHTNPWLEQSEFSLYIKNIYIYLFGSTRSQLQHVGSFRCGL